MNKARPASYEVTIKAEELWLLLRCFGSTSASDRINKYRHSKELDMRTSKAWSLMRDQLDKDGFPKFEWSEDE